jgi:chemotaxis protein methyltransferase CheR
VSIDAGAFSYVSELVRAEAAIVVGPGKEYLVESRLLPLARELGLGDAQALVAKVRLRPDAGLKRRIVEAMTTNETSFFRDRDPFRALTQVMLPTLRRNRASGASRRLTIWSAACSTGQEPYSIAMSCLEDPGLTSEWNVEIVGTDINQDVLDRARDARYTQLEVNRGLPASSLVSHFEQDGRDWRPIDQVRRMVTFRQLNLADSFAELPRFDIVFLRNVLIYFDAATRTDVLRRVRAAMAPDGYLVLGGAETILGLDDGFQRVRVGPATAYRPHGAAYHEAGPPGAAVRHQSRQRSVSRLAGR